MVSYWSACLWLVILGSASAMVVPYGTGNGHVVDKQPFGVKSPIAEEDTNNALEIDFKENPDPGTEEEIEENPGYFEGDIAGMDFSQLDGRNAILDETKTWTDGIIPYVMARTFSSSEKRSIEEAFDEYHRKTCLRFVPRTNEDDFIAIIRGKGCYSQVGRKGIGGQEVSIGSGCVKRPGVILHELMHVLGFWHEQSRADRDDYVTINWKNIKKGMEINFNKYPWTEIQHLNETYDVASVMHYGPYSFARNRLMKTIEPKDPSYDRLMGQREGFSTSDLAKINKLYKCEEKNQTWKNKESPNQKKDKKQEENKTFESLLKTWWKYWSKNRYN